MGNRRLLKASQKLLGELLCVKLCSLLVVSRGESGELLNINRNILIPTGKSIKEGVDTVEVLTSYFWQPVRFLFGESLTAAK